MKHARRVLYEQGEKLHRLSLTGWKCAAAFYSFNKVITTEYILGTWVLKISSGLDSKFCHFYVTLSSSLNLLKPQFLEYEIGVIVNCFEH